MNPTNHHYIGQFIQSTSEVDDYYILFVKPRDDFIAVKDFVIQRLHDAVAQLRNYDRNVFYVEVDVEFKKDSNLFARTLSAGPFIIIHEMKGGSFHSAVNRELIDKMNQINKEDFGEFYSSRWVKIRLAKPDVQRLKELRDYMHYQKVPSYINLYKNYE